MQHESVDTSNYVYLCRTANFWGSGADEAKAIASCRRAGGGESIRRYGYGIHRVHPKFEICEVTGAVFTPHDHPAILVRDAIKKRAKG